MFASLLASILLLQTAKPSPARAATPAAPPESDEYRIGAEDMLGIVVWQSNELTRAVLVRPDGRISLPLVNDVLVAGLTPMQARQVLLERYREFDKAVELTVIVQDANSFKVTLLGKVSSPGRKRLKSPTTILELLGEAGGLAEYADAENIVVLRSETLPGARSSGKPYRRIKFNYKRAIDTGTEADNFPLQPNDIVVVN